VILLLLAGCSREAPPGSPTPVPLSVDAVKASWPVRAALDERIDASLLSAVARRWLGGSGDWSAPGSPPGGAPPALAARWLREDAAALAHLRLLTAHAACRLAQQPGAFDGAVGVGYSVGARSCEAAGDAEGATRAASNAEARGGGLVAAPPPSGGEGPAILRLEAELAGETLLFEFVEPAELQAAIDGLIAAAAALPEPGSGPDQDVGIFFATRAGTSELLPEGQPPLLPSAASLFAALPASGRQAAAEVALDRALGRWTATLAQLPPETDGGLDASGRGLLDGWVRRAWQRELGLAALDAGEADLALVLLENATNNQTRVQPGPGLDPLLLIALARARYEANELQRAVALLEDIGDVAGWEPARVAARTVARVAVLPTAAEAQVKR
jgi:hypothetical protein